jgi:hypothetical protein
MCIAAAIVGGSVIGAGGSLLAGGQQADAQRGAARTQAGMFDTITRQEQPFLQAGYGANTRLLELLGLGDKPAEGSQGASDYGSLLKPFDPTMEQLEQYPGYQFAKTQGESALRNSLTPTVGALSGPALKSLINFNQGLATQTYNSAFGNYQTQQNNLFGRLSQLIGSGQNAAANLGSAGTQLGTGIAQAGAGAGASTAAGISGAAGNLGNSLSSIGLMNWIKPPSATGSGATFNDGAIWAGGP